MMFGRKKGERWDREATARHLSPVEDPLPWIGVELDMLRTEITRNLERNRLIGPSGSVIRYTSTRRTQILRSAMATGLAGPGLLGVVEVRSSDKTTSPDEFYNKATRYPKGQVAIGRLARPVEGHLLVAPHYTPKIFDRFESAAKSVLGDDIAPPRLDHPLLQHWWLELWGTIEPAQLAADPGLAALLWALRPKVAGEKVSQPQLAAECEQLIPEVERMYESAVVEIAGDIVALYRHANARGIDDKMADQVAHVTAHFR